jgi:hypothetical protein
VDVGSRWFSNIGVGLLIFAFMFRYT